MSNNSDRKSLTTGLIDQEGDFVLDFLYHDSRRVGSFLSQFNPGFLKNITRTDEVRQSEIEKSGRNFTLGAPKVFGGGNDSSEEASSSSANTAQKVFDPYWVNARTLLDELEDRKMIQRVISSANIGQFVLVKGFLNILDLMMFKEVWKLPTVNKMIKAGMIPAQKTGAMNAAQKAAAQEAKANGELFFEMLQVMPHSIHASLLSSGEHADMIWCSLAEEHLVMSASDITLAHGHKMPGEWSILGILSAYPEFVTPDPSTINDTVDLGPGVMQSVVGQFSTVIAPIVRLVLGRPAAAYSVTPLLIFREAS